MGVCRRVCEAKGAPFHSKLALTLTCRVVPAEDAYRMLKKGKQSVGVKGYL